MNRCFRAVGATAGLSWAALLVGQTPPPAAPAAAPVEATPAPAAAAAPAPETLSAEAMAELESRPAAPSATLETSPAEQTETEAERNQRLIEKHLSPLDRNLLNRFTLPLVGISNATRARQMEDDAEFQAWRERMDDTLRGLRRTNPEEWRRLREIYYDIVVQRGPSRW